MTNLDLSQNRVEGGFFLLSDRPAAPYRWPSDDGQDYRILGTYGPFQNFCNMYNVGEHENPRVFRSVVCCSIFGTPHIAAAEHLCGKLWSN